jgi:hypothetical protein
MPALTTRKAARERIQQLTVAALDRLIPADEAVPLKGNRFADFENQVYAVGNEILAAMMEERAKLERNAIAVVAGACPHCGSERTYLEKGDRQEEIRSPSGVVVVTKQDARCRACDGSFSPSSARLGLARGGSLDTAGGQACGTRGRDANG